MFDKIITKEYVKKIYAQTSMKTTMNYTDMYLIVSTNNKAYDIFSFFMSNNKITKLKLDFFLDCRFCLLILILFKSCKNEFIRF